MMSTYETSPSDGDQDTQHLMLLKVFYYVFAGLQGLSVLTILYQMAVISSMTSRMPSGLSDELGYSPGMTPYSAINFFLVLILCLTGSLLFANLITANSLGNRRNYMLCFVTACVNCLQFPLGTVLGIFTIIVLLRPSVKRLFQFNGF